MSWKNWSSGIKLGTLFTIIIFVVMGLFAVIEYVSCAPDFEGMCGVGLVIFGSFFGLGTPYLALTLFGSAIDSVAGRENVFLQYFLSAAVIIVMMMITYFIIGLIIGWIYGKIKQQKQ